MKKKYYTHEMKCPCKIWYSQQFGNFEVANDQIKLQDANGCLDAPKEEQKQVDQSLRVSQW